MVCCKLCALELAWHPPPQELADPLTDTILCSIWGPNFLTNCKVVYGVIFYKNMLFLTSSIEKAKYPFMDDKLRLFSQWDVNRQFYFQVKIC